MENNEKFFRCQCGGHAIGVDKFDWEDEDTEIFLSYWYQSGLDDNSIKERLKMIWKILTGSKHIYYDVLLNKQQAKELGEYLIKISEY